MIKAQLVELGGLGIVAKGAGDERIEAGVTGLALCAFLGAGYTNRGKHPFAKVVSKGLRYLKNVQDAEGCFGPRSAHYMYNHACAALAMVEAYGMTEASHQMASNPLPPRARKPGAVGVAAGPDVLNHNLETVKRLYPTVRPEAVYERSLTLLKNARESAPPDLPIKSGLMLGLGETREELMQAFQDLLRHGCSLLTLGQYLQPSKSHLDVDRFVPPEEFEALREDALGIGFKDVASGPFVRSSYHAREMAELGSS